MAFLEELKKYGPTLGSLAGFAIPGGGLLAGAIGGGLGSLAAGQGLEKAITTGLTAYASGAAMGALGSASGTAGSAVASPSPGGIKGALQTAANKTASAFNVTPNAAGAGQLYGSAVGSQSANPELLANLYQVPELQDRQYGSRLAPNSRRRRPLYAQAGGIMSMVPEEFNDKELVSAAIASLKGEMPQEQAVQVLARFASRFGREALIDLVEQMQSGVIAQNAGNAEGMIRGAGDGMDDLVPAKLGEDQDVLLSENEYVVPADVLSGIGNGSSDAGARKMDRLLDDVRMERTGTTEQASQIDADQMLSKMFA
jgi:hypothetical protein